MPRDRLLKRREIWRGRNIVLTRCLVRFDGHPPFERHNLEHPGAVAIVPVLPGKRVMLIRQYRFSVRGMLWEIPAGTLERGEDPRACAQRELMEEIGHRARRIEKLAVFFTAPGFCDERMHLYLARDLVPARRQGDADEFIEPRPFPFARALRMAERGLIRDAKSLTGLFLAARRLGVR